MKYLTENNDLFMVEDKLKLHKGLVFSDKQYERFQDGKSDEELEQIETDMIREIQIIKDNYEILKLKEQVIKEILKERKRKK